MEVSCVFARESHAAGGLAIALLRGINIPKDAVVLGQVHGHVAVDTRWVKIPSDLFQNALEFALPEQNVHLPRAPAPLAASSPCVFLTPREVISPSQLEDADGVYLQFDLPLDVLPSFRGLCALVCYSICITVQTPVETRQLFYPFNVIGRGTKSIPHLIKVSSLSVYAASALPMDNFLVPSSWSTSAVTTVASLSFSSVASTLQQEQWSVGGTDSTNIFNIRDQDLICSLAVEREHPSVPTQPGDELSIRLNFEEAIQPCRAVRARVCLCERRADGSRIQEKALCVATRCTQDASVIFLPLHLPSNVPCVFATPLFDVSFRIELEFFLNSSDGDKEPFSWCVDLQVHPPSPASSSLDETNACREFV